MKIRFFITLLLFNISTLQASTYYVDGTKGSDANSGSQDKPFATIQKAADLMVAFPMATQAVTSKYLYVGSEPGTRLGDSAKVLIVRPYKETGDEYDVEFHKAVVATVGSIDFNNADDRGVPVTFECMLDTSKRDGRMLCDIHYDNVS